MDEDKWREGRDPGEEQDRTERSRASTFHTAPELLLTAAVQVRQR